MFKQPSVLPTQQHFSQVPSAEIPRSRFDRSHGYKSTFDAGKLVPVFVDEVLPGDTFTMSSTAFARLATPLKPFMDNVQLDTHFFFVPARLVWDNWQEFMGERRNPDDDPNNYSVPQYVVPMAQQKDPESLACYFGLPLKEASAPGPFTTPLSVSALPFRAYNLIWNEWYRDENLQNRVPEYRDAGPDPISGESVDTYRILPRGKRKDYFTSALPWPQKGDPVLVPLGTEAPIVGLEMTRGQLLSGGTINDLVSFDTGRVGTSLPDGLLRLLPPTGEDAPYVDLAESTSVSINDLRTAFQIQRLLERDARGGTRYIELILSHFGVRSDDARLQRPEYLGGGTTSININPVANTSNFAGLGSAPPQGNLAAFGTAVGRGGFQKAFTEHGFIIGLVSARADLTYQNGVERFWSRRTRYDYYWPALAHLGEQAILNKEIKFIPENSADENDSPWGYQERYAEYRYKPTRITGLFSSAATASLDVWHLAQDFADDADFPVLAAPFIEENPPIDRVIAVPTEPHFLIDMWFDLKCDRPMPVYSVPGLIDHF